MIKIATKPVKKQKEKPVGFAGEDKQNKGNRGDEKSTVDSTKFKFCDETTRRRCEGKGEGGVRGREEKGKR